MIWIGVDPGTPLTVAALSTDGAAILGIHDEDAVSTREKRASRKTLVTENSPELLASVLRPYAALGAQVAVERVSPMPGQGLASTARFVGSMHMTVGLVAGLGIPYRLVTPVTWKRAMDLSSDKERSRAMAARMWPRQADLFRLKKHHDRAEAALLALWLLRNETRAPA